MISPRKAALGATLAFLLVSPATAIAGATADAREIADDLKMEQLQELERGCGPDNKSVKELRGSAPQEFLELFFPVTFVLQR